MFRHENLLYETTKIFHSITSVIIFVVMILLRKRVWRALAAKSLCGMRCANCWQKMEDEETDNEVVDEQQLSADNVAKP
ncbi:hypothetical protein J6590_017915 [Homalodisca vitripennis]|nr:hypothetical protein J6590_017915 [Homalodisca vitripennis]